MWSNFAFKKKCVSHIEKVWGGGFSHSCSCHLDLFKALLPGSHCCLPHCCLCPCGELGREAQRCCCRPHGKISTSLHRCSQEHPWRNAWRVCWLKSDYTFPKSKLGWTVLWWSGFAYASRGCEKSNLDRMRSFWSTDNYIVWPLRKVLDLPSLPPPFAPNRIFLSRFLSSPSAFWSWAMDLFLGAPAQRTRLTSNPPSAGLTNRAAFASKGSPLCSGSASTCQKPRGKSGPPSGPWHSHQVALPDFCHQASYPNGCIRKLHATPLFLANCHCPVGHWKDRGHRKWNTWELYSTAGIYHIVSQVLGFMPSLAMGLGGEILRAGLDLQSFATTEERIEPAQPRAPPTLPKSLPKDTLVNGIEGPQEVKWSEDGRTPPIPLPSEIIQKHDQGRFRPITTPEPRLGRI